MPLGGRNLLGHRPKFGRGQRKGKITAFSENKEQTIIPNFGSVFSFTIDFCRRGQKSVLTDDELISSDEFFPSLLHELKELKPHA